MKCTDCKFCILEDYGYSNWTVEGTTVTCLLELNASFPADRWYGEASELEFANECTRFAEGSNMHIDVDNEQGARINYTEDPEVREILEKEIIWTALNNK